LDTESLHLYEHALIRFKLSPTPLINEIALREILCEIEGLAMAFKALILDFDQTLVDSIRDFYAAYNLCLVKYGKPPIEWHIFLQDYRNDRLARFLPDRLQRNFWKDFLHIIGRIFDNCRLLPGSREALLFARGCSFLIAVTTGRYSPSTLFHYWLSLLGIKRLIDAAVTRAEVPTSEGKLPIFVKAAQKLGVDPQECVIVGDYLDDMQAASQLRAVAVGVLTGYMDSKALKSAGAQWVLDGIYQLPLVLSRYSPKR